MKKLGKEEERKNERKEGRYEEVQKRGRKKERKKRGRKKELKKRSKKKEKRKKERQIDKSISDLVHALSVDGIDFPQLAGDVGRYFRLDHLARLLPHLLV